MTDSAKENHSGDQPGQAPTDVSKPIGDAIPAPREPGLDQPLPPKDSDNEPLGDPDPAPGVPDLDGSDFA